MSDHSYKAILVGYNLKQSYCLILKCLLSNLPIDRSSNRWITSVNHNLRSIIQNILHQHFCISFFKDTYRTFSHSSITYISILIPLVVLCIQHQFTLLHSPHKEHKRSKDWGGSIHILRFAQVFKYSNIVVMLNENIFVSIAVEKNFCMLSMTVLKSCQIKLYYSCTKLVPIDCHW